MHYVIFENNEYVIMKYVLEKRGKIVYVSDSGKPGNLAKVKCAFSPCVVRIFLMLMFKKQYKLGKPVLNNNKMNACLLNQFLLLLSVHVLC